MHYLTHDLTLQECHSWTGVSESLTQVIEQNVHSFQHVPIFVPVDTDRCMGYLPLAASSPPPLAAALPSEPCWVFVPFWMTWNQQIIMYTCTTAIATILYLKSRVQRVVTGVNILCLSASCFSYDIQTYVEYTLWMCWLTFVPTFPFLGYHSQEKR